MAKCKYEKKILVLYIIVSLFILTTQCLAQCVGKMDVFDKVPSEVRDRLRERLNLRIEYERTEQWDKFYELLYEKNINKKEFIKLNSENVVNYRMIKFIPKIISRGYLNNNNAYLIEGCATIKYKGKFKLENDIIVANLVDEDWFFSSFGEVAPNKLCKQ